MLADTRIILRHHPYEVHAQRHEVMFRDCSAVQLHPVHAHGLPMLLLRVLELDDTRFQLFDLGKLVPALGRALPAVPERDVIGHVFFTLRAEYSCAASFAAHVHQHAIGTWTAQPGGDEFTWESGVVARQAAAQLLGAVPRGPLARRAAA